MVVVVAVVVVVGGGGEGGGGVMKRKRGNRRAGAVVGLINKMRRWSISIHNQNIEQNKHIKLRDFISYTERRPTACL